jgi:hypothetical protein
VTTLITPPRRRGVEYLDHPGVDPRLVRRSLADVALANTLFGGTRAVLLEIGAVLPGARPTATLLDVGSGVGDIAARARQLARTHGKELSLVTIDMAETLAAASRARARQTPFAVMRRRCHSRIVRSTSSCARRPCTTSTMRPRRRCSESSTASPRPRHRE